MSDGMREEPGNLVERAADAALEAIERVLGDAGAKVLTAYVAVHAGDVPAGELDAVAAAGGDELPTDLDERARDVVAFLVAEAASAGRAIGFDVRVVPMPTPGQG